MIKMMTVKHQFDFIVTTKDTDGMERSLYLYAGLSNASFVT